MAGKLTGLFLAILIANPFCCCLVEAASKAPAPDTHACCHPDPGGAVPQAPGQSEPCECGEDTREPWVLTAEIKPAPPQWTLLTEISWAHCPEITVSPGLHSPGAFDFPDAVRPPGKILAQVHCRYLL